MDAHGELPSLKATISLGGLAKSDLNTVQVYDVKFYPYTLPGVDPVFAVCGGPHVIVCRCVLETNRTIEILQWSEKDQERPANNAPSIYNSLAWSQAGNGDPLLCVAGDATRQIHVFNIATKQLVASIGDLAVSPIDPTILASCSIDHTVRIWSLDPAHKDKPLVAICYGQGHTDQILSLAYHRKGRYILSAGMDTRINLWVVPDALKDRAGTDEPVMVHYPHFSTTEVHTDFVDSLKWYNDHIFSHASREEKIILWKIDGFSSDRDDLPDAPIPTSKTTTSRTPVIIPANSHSSTRSAWGGRFQRLLQFDLPDITGFYLRLSLFHEVGRHPILVAGNEKSKAFFWDLQKLEDCGTGEDNTQDEGPEEIPLGLPRHVRDGSIASTASSTVSTGSSTTKTKAKTKKAKAKTPDHGIGDPFVSIQAHKIIEIPKYNTFAFHQFAWSRDGQWCVGAGGGGMINVFNRWEKGVPPAKSDSEAVLLMQ
ncbi:WD40-repeat-containing domain protein [Phaeosphaeriaceae sp. PMI808]|nr:WD40-repeat-containing domain protein [Phaeosphaeriaceae sp. PMI808]